MRKLIPQVNRVLIRPVEPEAVSSIIHTPDTAQNQPTEGEIVAIGPLADDVGPVTLDLKVGDIVVFSKYAGVPYTLNRVDHIILSAEEVLAKVVDEG